jgi:hypothetical protein
MGVATDSHINSVRIGKGANSVSNNTVVGVSTGSQMTAASAGVTAVGFQAGFWNSSGNGNTTLGSNAGVNIRTGSWNSAFGINAMLTNQSGSHNVSVGLESLYSNTTDFNVGIGSNAAFNSTSSGIIAIGYNAAKFQSDGSTALTGGASSIYIGTNVKGLNNSDSNTIVIGASAIADGANTTVLNTTSTTQTKIAGTSSSTLIVSGQNLRLVTQRTIATASSTGTQGDICHDSNYIYVCVATNTWKRVLLSTW